MSPGPNPLVDPDRLLELSIEMDNPVIGGHPGTLFGLHLCRGNNQSKFYASGDYGPITKVFRQTKFQRFLLEFDASAATSSKVKGKSA